MFPGMANAYYESVAAMGPGPIAQTSDGAYVSVSGDGPSFPSTDTLARGSFMVAVSSDDALSTTNGTSDFVVNVAAYAPRTTPVTKVTLVDVDVPPTQKLIEPPWSRVYFTQGLRYGTDQTARTMQLVVSSTTVASVVLPANLSVVRTYTKNPSTYSVTIFLQDNAPAPIDAMVKAWQAQASKACGQELRLVNCPGGLGTFVLSDAEALRDHTALSFTVTSMALFTALPDEPPAPGCMALAASPVAGPTYLSTILTRGMQAALPEWSSFEVYYDAASDRFRLYMTAPCPDPSSLEEEDEQVLTCILGGGLPLFMGFGSSLTLDLPRLKPTEITARTGPALGPEAYADLECGSPRDCTALRNLLQGALNGALWPVGSVLGVSFPGAVTPPTAVAVPYGHGTLDDVIDILELDMTPLGIRVRKVLTGDGSGAQGVAFDAIDGVTAFSLDFTTVLQPERLGYVSVVDGPAVLHMPMRAASHIPLWCDGTLLAVSDVQVFCDCDTLHVRTVPFEGLPGEVTAVGPCPGVVSIETSGMHGLVPGASVIVVGPLGEQYPGVVGPTASFWSLTLSAYIDPTATLAVGNEVTVLPMDRAPLTFFMTRTRKGATLPSILGFTDTTIEAPCGQVRAFGVADTRQDPFVLLCLGFDGTEAEPLTGDLYYPVNACPLVFAKVPRAGLFRSDFYRTFEHVFEGAGRTLGFIRVRFLNPNGTLYQTHGHPTMATLQFACRQNTVGFGGGRVVAPYREALQFDPRQSLPVAGGRAGLSEPVDVVASKPPRKSRNGSAM